MCRHGCGRMVVVGGGREAACISATGTRRWVCVTVVAVEARREHVVHLCHWHTTDAAGACVLYRVPGIGMPSAAKTLSPKMIVTRRNPYSMLTAFAIVGFGSSASW